jgi:hypothetical protein
MPPNSAACAAARDRRTRPLAHRQQDLQALGTLDLVPPPIFGFTGLDDVDDELADAEAERFDLRAQREVDRHGESSSKEWDI